MAGVVLLLVGSLAIGLRGYLALMGGKPRGAPLAGTSTGRPGYRMESVVVALPDQTGRVVPGHQLLDLGDTADLYNLRPGGVPDECQTEGFARPLRGNSDDETTHNQLNDTCSLR